MKIGILLTCFNRPGYLRQCLWSLERVELPKDHHIYIVDDASTDPKTYDLLTNFISRIPNSSPCTKRENKGIKDSLLLGYDFLFNIQKCDIVINFDSDAIIRPDAVTKLIENYHKTGHGILTGFHSVTKNANGSDRHKIKYDFEDILVKLSVGGINFCINKQAYINFVEPALKMLGNWDHNACIRAGGAWCLKESVVQHIGFDSSLNHNEAPDIADDFYYWDLPTVTLLGVDNEPERLNKAKDICTKWIKFGDVVTLNPDIRSKEAYSQFMIKEAYKHVHTSHCLIFQYDGYVNNWMAWDNDWLQYDYIGAPWHYMDGMAVGNGGFSLRSHRLMQIIAKDPLITFTHPEDHHICRTYRKYLEKTYDIKFAPIEVAEKFSFEGYLQPNKILGDQFGVHGKNPRKEVAKPIDNKRYVIGQFASLGDILWLVPLVRALQAEGNFCTWPVNREYVALKKHFPDIDFRDKATIPINYESRVRCDTPYGHWLPYRYASENMGRRLDACMRSKYEIYHHDWQMFRTLEWNRDLPLERELFDYVTPQKPYILVNRLFGSEGQYKITPEIKSDLPIVEMRPIDGFTLLDWGMVIENAAEIHSANTSLLYILEQLSLKMPIHLYARGIWGEKSFEYTSFIHSKPYILH